MNINFTRLFFTFLVINMVDAHMYGMFINVRNFRVHHIKSRRFATSQKKVRVRARKCKMPPLPIKNIARIKLEEIDILRAIEEKNPRSQERFAYFLQQNGAFYINTIFHTLVQTSEGHDFLKNHIKENSKTACELSQLAQHYFHMLHDTRQGCSFLEYLLKEEPTQAKEFTPLAIPHFKELSCTRWGCHLLIILLKQDQEAVKKFIPLALQHHDQLKSTFMGEYFFKTLKEKINMLEVRTRTINE